MHSKFVRKSLASSIVVGSAALAVFWASSAVAPIAEAGTTAAHVPERAYDTEGAGGLGSAMAESLTPSAERTLMATIDDEDCHPSGHSYSQTPRTFPNSVTWDEEPVTEYCWDGTVVHRVKKTKTVEENWRTEVTTYRVDGDGLTCPSTSEVTDEWTVFVSSTTWEEGPICPPEPGDCCRTTRHSSTLEVDPAFKKYDTTYVTVNISCPDGTPGKQTTKTTICTKRRRFVYRTTEEATGACAPQYTCSDGYDPGPWQYYIYSTTVHVTNDCF